MKKSFLFAAVIAMVAIAATSCKKLEAKFSYEADGLTVEFKNQSVAADSYVWDFGDATETSTAKDPSHTYAAAGEYTVILTASNGKESDQAKQTITVEIGEGGSLISVTDNSVADWDEIPVDNIAKASCPENTSYLGLKRAWVYADATYINILIEYDPEEIPYRSNVPFHVYFNTDNSDATGGYGDQWTDANSDISLEGHFFVSPIEDDKDPAYDPLVGDPVEYDPGVYPWIGEVGANGWSWAEEKLTAGTFCHSQHIAGNIVEIQMVRELIPTLVGWDENEFGVGFDIQQNWNSVGILPIADETEENPTGHAAKLQVRIIK